MAFTNKLTNGKKKTYKYIERNHTPSEEDKSQDSASKDFIAKREDNQKEQKLKMFTYKLKMKLLEENWWKSWRKQRIVWFSGSRD